MNQQQIGLLVSAQGDNQAALSQYAASTAGAAAGSFSAWYDHAAIATWAAALAAQIESVQSQAASSTDAYLAEVLADMRDRRVAPSGTISVADLRQGVSHTEVYGRSADVFRYQRSLGKSEEEAQQAAVQRAEVIAQTDVQLAARAQSHKFMVVKRVDYRRVIHPEVSRGGSCGLCVAASTRIYHRGDLLPIHARCACTTIPIVNDQDPGGAINQEDLRGLYRQAGGSTSGAKLKRVRYVVHSNGELGPILGVKGQVFRGPAEVAADVA